MEYSVEDILNEHFEGLEYDTEEEMLNDIDLFVEDIVQDAYRWARRFTSAPQQNAEDLDIKVGEYASEESE